MKSMQSISRAFLNAAAGSLPKRTRMASSQTFGLMKKTGVANLTFTQSCMYQPAWCVRRWLCTAEGEILREKTSPVGTRIAQNLEEEQKELEQLENAVEKALEHHATLLESEQPVATSSIWSSLHTIRDYYEKLMYWDQALRIEEELYSNLDEAMIEQRADSLHRQGKLQRRLDNPRCSQRLYQKALEMFNEAIVQEFDPRKGVVLVSMAGVDFYDGNIQEALEKLKGAESHFSEKLSRFDMVQCLKHQGLVYRSMEEFAVALDCYQRASEILSRAEVGTIEVSEVLEVKQSLQMDIADMYAALGLHIEALEAYQALLEHDMKDDDARSERALDGIVWHAIGKIHAQQYQKEKADRGVDNQDLLRMAKEELEHAVQIKENWFGGESSETGKTYRSLGAVCAILEDHQHEALAWFKKALLVARIHAQDENDPEVMYALRNVAVLQGESIDRWEE